ncbi:MAG: hypothetical protein ACE5HO_20470 [bacterium]
MESTIKQRILKICEELGEEMDSPACQALHEYIKTCPNCQAFVDSVKKTIKLYQDYSPKYSSEIHKKLFKTLELK